MVEQVALTLAIETLVIAAFAMDCGACLDVACGLSAFRFCRTLAGEMDFDLSLVVPMGALLVGSHAHATGMLVGTFYGAAAGGLAYLVPVCDEDCVDRERREAEERLARRLTKRPETAGLGWDVLVDLCEQDGRFAEAYGAMLRLWARDPEDEARLARVDQLRQRARIGHNQTHGRG